MKIRKFNEADDQQTDLSSERIEEIIAELKEFASLIDSKGEIFESLSNELNNYKGLSKNGNDQIDDSIANLQLVKKHISDCTDKIDNVINNMNDYNENGRKYLY